jgi:hypothetical protein
MNPTDASKPTDSDVPINPEDSPRLQAIEALEAREVDPNPKPYDPNSLRSQPHVHAPEPKAPALKPVEPPKTIEPVKPVAPEEPVTPIDATPDAPVPKPVEAPAPKPAPKPKRPKSLPEEMAEEIATLPPTRAPFQFFHDQNGLRKNRVIAAVGIGAALLAIAVVIIGLSLG